MNASQLQQRWHLSVLGGALLVEKAAFDVNSTHCQIFLA